MSDTISIRDVIHVSELSESVLTASTDFVASIISSSISPTGYMNTKTKMVLTPSSSFSTTSSYSFSSSYSKSGSMSDVSTNSIYSLNSTTGSHSITSSYSSVTPSSSYSTSGSSSDTSSFSRFSISASFSSFVPSSSYSVSSSYSTSSSVSLMSISSIVAITASYDLSSSYVYDSTSASYSDDSVSSSYSLFSPSASFSITTSTVPVSFSSSISLNAASSSHTNNSISSSHSDSTISSSYTLTGSWLDSIPFFTINSIGTSYETSGSASFFINRSGNKIGRDSVEYTTVNDTALSGTDFSTITGSITFDPGVTSITFNVPLITTGTQLTNSFKSRLQFARGAVLSNPVSASCNIVHNMWNPSQLGSSVSAWYDTMDTSSLTLSGPNVIQWNDKSGNGSDVYQASAPSQPIYSSITKRISFEATGSQYLGASSFQPSTGNDPMSFFIVLDSTRASIPYPVVTWGTYLAGMCSYQESTIASIISGGVTGSIYDSHSSTNTGLHIAGVTYDGSVITMYNNGTSLGADSGSMLVQAGDPLFMGFQAGYQYGNCDLTEIVMCNIKVSAVDRYRIEGYLAWKWNLVAGLPVGHPYKNTPPI